MKTVFLTYCTPSYRKTAKKLIRSAKRFGLTDIAFYTREDLVKTEYYQNNRRILDLPQRAGCSLWKIYYIHQEYFKLNEGEILFYADAGSNIIADPSPLIELCRKKDIVLFNLNSNPLNRHWTKRDAFVYMDCDADEYKNAPHFNAAFQLYKRTPHNDVFINEMLKYGEDIRIISDLPNVSGLDNADDFVEHRFDQSILSLLACKFKIEAHRYPAQYGNAMKLPAFRKKGEWLPEPYWEIPMENSPYATIFDHHRNKKKFEDLFTKKTYLLFKHKIKCVLIKWGLYK